MLSHALRISFFLILALFLGSVLNFALGIPLYIGVTVSLIVSIAVAFVKLPEGSLATSLAATLTQGYRSSYAGRLDKNEQRNSTYGALQLFKDQTNSPTGIIDAETMALIKRSFGNTVSIPVINYQDVSISNVRTCALQTGGPTSALVSITFATYSFGFGMYPAQFYNNDIRYQQVFDKNMQAYENKLAAALDLASVAKLESARNTYFPASITGSYYANTGSALQVPLASQALFFNMVPSILETMDYAGNVNDVTTPYAMALIRNWAAQGQANQTNTAFQFGGQRFYPTSRITNNSGVASTHYLVADDSVALVSRLDPDAIMGSVVGGGQKSWSVERLPIVDMDFALYYNEDCTNAAAIQSAGTEGLTRSKVESYEFSADIAFVSAYNSSPSTNFGPIVKAELLTT